MQNLKRGVQFAGILAGVGVIVGVIAGWWGVSQADGAQTVAAQSGAIYPILAILLPITLIAITVLDINNSNAQRIYGTQRTAFEQVLTAGVAGALFASGLFLYGAFQVAAVFGGEDPVEMMNNLRVTVFQNAPLVIGITILSAVLIGIWAHRSASQKMS